MRRRHRNRYVPQPETGERIREAREAQGLRMRDFEIPSSTIARFEQGDRIPSMDILISVARTLKTTALLLATGEHGRCPYCGRDGPRTEPPPVLTTIVLLIVVLVLAAEIADLLIPGSDIKDVMR